MKNINLVLFLLMLTFSMVSCSDDFLDQGPQSTMPSEQVFSKVENIDPYMLGLYNQWRSIHKGRGGIYYGTDEAALGVFRPVIMLSVVD